MTTVWTSEQVTGMAPDTASVAAGRKQAGARKWQTLGRSDEVLWGEIKGSGANPYQVCIELAAPAFKCSCPSHKFPCKHGLGLAYVFAEEAAAMPVGEPPQWVREWLDGRAARAQKKAERADREAEPESPEAAEKQAAAQEKRSTARRDKMSAGVDELDRWLRDLIRQGLATHAAQPYGFWEQMAPRMVDAQAPGLARELRRLGELRFGTVDWQSRLLEHIARLHLLLSAWRRIDSLEPAMRAHVEALVGLPQDKEAVLAQPGLRDDWLVLGSRIEQEDNLRARRTWVLGRASGRYALLLDFAVNSQVFPTQPPAGSHWRTELVFYPGVAPLRALVKEDGGTAEPPQQGPDGIGSLAEAQRGYGEALLLDPWLDRHPLLLEGVTPEYVDEAWRLRDAEGACLPISPRFEGAWELLAVSGGRPLSLFGEWDGHHFLPLNVFAHHAAAQPARQAA